MTYTDCWNICTRELAEGWHDMSTEPHILAALVGDIKRIFNAEDVDIIRAMERHGYRATQSEFEHVCNNY